MSGSLADGAPCASDAQCEATSYCGPGAADAGLVSRNQSCGRCTASIADGSSCGIGIGPCRVGSFCEGTCVQPVLGDLGADCGIVPTVCKSGLFCAPPGRCEPLGASGASCGIASECQVGLVCLGGTTCGTPAALGSACVPGDCAPGLTCDATTQTCTKIRFGKPGDACGSFTLQCERGYCILANGAASGTCPTMLPLGASCSNNPNFQCDVWAPCLNGKCQIAN